MSVVFVEFSVCVFRLTLCYNSSHLEMAEILAWDVRFSAIFLIP